MSTLILAKWRLAGEALRRGDAKEVERHLLAAWDLLPLPKTEHALGPALAGDLTDLYRGLDRPEEARLWLAIAREASVADQSASEQSASEQSASASVSDQGERGATSRSSLVPPK